MNKPDWELTTQDPEELRHLARRANGFNNQSNKRPDRRGNTKTLRAQ
jgi:hypothetical protein